MISLSLPVLPTACTPQRKDKKFLSTWLVENKHERKGLLGQLPGEGSTAPGMRNQTQASPASSLLTVFRLHILLTDELENHNLEVFWALLELRDPIKASSAVHLQHVRKNTPANVAPARVLLLLPLIPPFHS